MDTSFDRDAQNERRRQEVMGPTHHINATRPVRSIGDMQSAREAEVTREHSTTRFPSMGQAVVAELLDHEFNVSGDPRPGIEIPRQALRVGRGVLEARIGSAGVDPLANLGQPEGKDIRGASQFDFGVNGDPEAYAAAEKRFHMRNHRHFPHHDHPDLYQ